MKFNIKKVAATFLSAAMLTTGSTQLSVFAQQTLKYEAENGQNGMKRNRFGKAGQDLIIKIPCLLYTSPSPRDS